MTGVRHYIAAGALEPPFLRAAQEWADRLRRAGLDVRFEKFRGGHDDLWWQQHLVAGLAWAHSGAYGFSGAIGSRQP